VKLKLKGTELYAKPQPGSETTGCGCARWFANCTPALSALMARPVSRSGWKVTFCPPGSAPV
jgi:hypothetical protein